jgi:O-antigen chain-terminating methyltransferase
VAGLRTQGERSSRLLRAGEPPSKTWEGTPTTASSAPDGPAVDLDAFFADFQERFRGSEDEISSRLQTHVGFLIGLAPIAEGLEVLEMGCGRGELLALLGDAGVAAQGVDTNALSVRRVVEKGCRAVVGDGLSHLRSLEPASVGAVVGIHVVEHLPFQDLLELVLQCYRVLTPGGGVVFETPNPESGFVGSFSFWLDPSHQRPLPSPLLSFILEHFGFQTEVVLLQPIRPVSTSASPEVRDVYNHYFGWADYAVHAVKP